MFVLEASGSGLNFIKFICHFRIILCDSGLNIFIFLFETPDICLNVFEGLENCVFSVVLCCLDHFPRFLDCCGYICEHGSTHHDVHGFCFARRVE